MTGCKILVVDDEEVIRESLKRILESEGNSVSLAESGFGAIARLQGESFHIVITDLKMPGMNGMEVLRAIRVLQPEVPVIFITGYSTVETAVEAMKNGAFDYLAKPFTAEQILEKVQKAMEQRAFLLEQHQPEEPLKGLHGLDRIVGQSPQMRKVFERVAKVAPTESTVLITGDSGTGKELVARAIYQNSPRRHNPFIAVDCSSLVESLLESELFGHVKGSFTGAVQTKRGLFQVADGGTLFLDEVGNLALPTQAKLLRTLQERKVTPIGETRPVDVDIRLVAASNRDLAEMVDSGSFRQDLYFRLNIVPINLPRLVDREGDLPLLVAHFLKAFAEEMGKGIRGVSPAAMALLRNYPFPGNVRELENIIERAVVLAQGPIIEPGDLEIVKPQEDTTVPEPADAVPGDADTLKAAKKRLREEAVIPLERAFVLAALERNGWNVTKAAEEVGMQRPNFQALLKKLGVSVRDRQAGEEE
jgi:two-component system response regulator PilR (NtrC family)